MKSTQLRQSALLRLRDRARGQIRDVRRFFDKRHLDVELATLLEAADGQEAQGVPPGSPAYLILLQHFEHLLGAYCERWQQTSEQLKAEMPAFTKLQRLARPGSFPQSSAAVKPLLLVFAILASAFLAGIAGALVSLAYHLGGGR